jgi:hypothetical protein
MSKYRESLMSKHTYIYLFLIAIPSLAAISLQKHSLEIKTIGEAMAAFPVIVESVGIIDPKAGEVLQKTTEPVEDVGEIMLTIAHLLDTIDPLLATLPQTKDRMVCAIGSKEARSKNQRCQQVQCIDRSSCVKKIIIDLKAMLNAFVDHVVLGVSDNNRFYRSILDSSLKVAKQENVRKDIEPVLEAITITIQILDELEELIK